MRFLIKIIAVIVCLTLLLGCTKTVIAEPGPKDVIYKFTEFTPTDETYDMLIGLAYDDDFIYMLTQKIEAGDNGAVENFYQLKTDTSGNVIDKELLSSATEEETASAGYTYYMGLAVKSEDEIYLVRQTALNASRQKSKIMFVTTTEDGTVKEEIVTNEDEEEPKTKTELVKREGGTETVLTDISGKLEPLGVDTAYLYVSDFEVDKNGFAYMTINADMVYAFDLSTGEIAFENKPLPQSGIIRGLYKDAKGEISVVSYKQIVENDETLNKLIISPINPKTNAFGKEEIIDAPSGNDSNLAIGDKNFSFYGFSSSKICGYKNGNRILVADLPASGVNLSEVTRVIPVSDTKFLITGYTADTIGLEKLYMLTKIKPEDVLDKSIITVAAISEPRYLADYIREFTLTHPQYQVDYKGYAVDTKTSYDDALTAFNIDITRGDIPDVIVIEPEMPYGNYVRKGLLADLYPFIDNDPDYSREDFLQPILTAFETEGKLYSIAPAFNFLTLVGKTSIFGERQSFAELQAIAEAHGASLFGTGVTRDVFTDVIITRMARGFIDDVNGVCSFNSNEFISLLEYAKSLPTPTPDAEPFGFSFVPGETNDSKTNKALIKLLTVFDFRHIVSLEKMEFGEPVSFLGFPNGTGGSGILAAPTLETAIPEKAKNPNGAWEFVKGLLTYSNPIIKNTGYPPLFFFPTLMSELNTAAEKAMIPAYETWGGERFPRKNWLGADLSNQPNNTEEDNAKMFALFESIEGIDRTVPAIENIVAEETASYFAGNKTAKETAEIIQNRATTYLEEVK